MDEVINHNQIPKSSAQLVYPILDDKKDTFMVVINLPPVTYDEIMVTIEPQYIEVSARLIDPDPVLKLLNVNNTKQIYTTKVSLPEGLDIENADAYHNGGAVTIYMPYI